LLHDDLLAEFLGQSLQIFRVNFETGDIELTTSNICMDPRGRLSRLGFGLSFRLSR
jgi:hypothetical protein